jgi:phosphopantothenoylcysteine decarboxylase/phosphopantothenate--cysteine ligase
VDLGWVVGELVELKWQVGGDPGQWQRLTDALCDGYGRELGPDWHRMAALRVLLHVHDFAGYAGGTGDWLESYVGFLRFLIDL